MMRGVAEPSWQLLHAPEELDVMGIWSSPLALRTRMSAPARLRPEPE